MTRLVHFVSAADVPDFVAGGWAPAVDLMAEPHPEFGVLMSRLRRPGECWEAFTQETREGVMQKRGKRNFVKDTGPKVPDYSSRDGAEKLGRKIEAYWRGQGFETVRCYAVSGYGQDATEKLGRHDLRSNMIGGLPPRRV